MKIKLASKSSKEMGKLFLRSVLITFGFVVVVGIIMAIAGRGLLESRRVKTDYEEYVPKTQRGQSDNGKKAKNVKMKDKTVMIFGVDKDETRTDTILLAHFDSETKKINIVSIPRDTKVYWTDEQIEKAKELDRPYQDYCKITEMSSYGGIDNLRHFTIRSVEEMLDLKVDNYVVLNTKVVREIVDSLGGIEVNVPRVMEYDDNSQDLHIDLQPGMQLLNGAQAEGVLRWRHNKDYSQQYGMGDLGRIETQQLFTKAFMDKVINDVSLDTITKIVTTIYKNVKTDVSFSEALSYVNYLPNLSVSNLKMNTLPGEPVHQSKWYFIVDESAVDDFVNENILGIPSIGTPRTKIPVISGDGDNESYDTSDYSNNEVIEQEPDDDYNQELIDQEKSQEEAALEGEEDSGESTEENIEVIGDPNSIESASGIETENTETSSSTNGESGIGNAPAVVPENDTAYPPTTSEGNVPESEGSVESTQEPIFEGGTESVPPTSQEGDMSNEPLFINEGDMLSGMQ